MAPVAYTRGQLHTPMNATQAQGQSQQNQIGLDSGKLETTANALNEVLAAYHVLYQNLRGFHWNVKGHRFFELHQKYEELYEQAKDYIDQIAERILTLGYTPYHTMTDFLTISGMQEVKNVFQDVEIVRLTVRDYGQMITKLRRAWETADNNEDVGTTSMLEEFIGSHEKTIWMLNSWLNKFTADI